MIAIYARWIKAGRMQLSDVPEVWREKVREALKDEG